VARRFSPDRIVNPVRRRIFRTRISPVENVVSALLVLVVLAAGAWVLAQRDNFDPADRDISIEALRAGSIGELPYHAPVRRWRPPDAATGAGAPTVPLDPFPATLLDGGFTVDGRVEHYGPDNVYVKINGAAEQYLRYGFRQLHYVTLARDGLFVTLEVYDQGRFAGALGVFAALRDPSRPLERHGAVRFYRTSVGAIGLAGPYFFRITANREDPAVTAKADGLVDVVGALPRPQDAGDDAPFRVLTDGLGVPFENVSYEQENAFQYEFMSDVWFGRTDADGAARWFLHRAADEAAAAELFAQLVDEQSFEYETVEQDAGRVLLRHRQLGDRFAVAVIGPWLCGVEGADDDGTARSLLERLAGEIRNVR